MQFFVFIQITYLIDEAFNVGKGANAIISLLHHFFEHRGLGETEAFMHADNCSGQNKNKYMMQYLMWRVKSGLHTDITILFLPVGHTKFAPDWCFGLAKQTFRRTRVDTLDDIANSVSKSSFVNVPQLVGDLDGTCFVPMYDWAEFLEEHTIKTALKGIKAMHHFRFSSKSPGMVYVKNQDSDVERKIQLARDVTWSPSPNELPRRIEPPGLPLERQWYLYNKIREFCRDDAKDLVCPKPSQPLPT